MLRPELRGCFDAKVAALRERYGEFLLINANFSFVNHFFEDMNLVQRNSAGKVVSISAVGRGLSRQFAGGMARHQQAIFDSFSDLLQKLATRFAPAKIILRPHPSENHAAWLEAVAGLENFEVEHDGNVAPWLIACRELLHNGCTTAVETAVLGAAAIAYRPVASEVYDYHLPNGLSHQAATVRAGCACVDATLAGTLCAPERDRRRRLIAHYFASMRGPLAADRIIEVLVRAGYLTGMPPCPGRVSRAYGRSAMHVSALIQKLKMRVPGHRTNRRRYTQYFPKNSAVEINARIGLIGQQLGRFDEIRAQATAEHLFSISRCRG